MTVEIKGLIEASLIDWPGKLATVVFVPGCNLRCRYCHARDLVTNSGAIEPISAETVFEYLRTMDGWIDGVVISGGEPTLYPDLPRLAAEIKAMNLAVKLDTNGTRPRVLEYLIREGLIDAVSMDVKAPLDTRYFDVTQTVFDLDDLKASISVVKGCGIEHEFRTTVAPELLTPTDIGRIAEAISGARRYTLQPFNPHVCLDERMESMPACPTSYLEDAARLAEGFVEKVVVIGARREFPVY
jgi:pyruvate formate lyase activating enzyme